MTQKQACVKKFRSAKVSNSHNTVTTPTTSSATPMQKPDHKSFDLLNAGIASVDPTILQHMSQKVERLLNKENAIVQAPGSAGNTAFMVESDSSPRPHHVTVVKNGKVSCSDCPSWKARNVCAHSFAAVEKFGMTAKFLKWFKTKGHKRVNLITLVTCNTAKGVGKKRKKATSVCKGGRNAGKALPAVVVDRVRFRAEPPPQHAAATSTAPVIFTTQHCNSQLPVHTYQHPLGYSGCGNVVQSHPVHPSQVLTCPPVYSASNAMQLNVTPPPPEGSLPERFPMSQAPVVVNSTS